MKRFIFLTTAIIVVAITTPNFAFAIGTTAFGGPVISAEPCVDDGTYIVQIDNYAAKGAPMNIAMIPGVTQLKQNWIFMFPGVNLVGNVITTSTDACGGMWVTIVGTSLPPV